MACMAHDCRVCGMGWFDNQSGGPCPRCGSLDVTSDFDEPPESFEEDFFEWSIDDEDA